LLPAVFLFIGVGAYLDQNGERDGPSPNKQGAAGRHGIRWHYARPPVVDVEYEMDVRGVHQELILPG
jgi:hypothetical protein